LHNFDVQSEQFPSYDFENLQQIQIFCNGLRPGSETMLDTSPTGYMNTKSTEEAKIIVEAITSNE